MSDSFIILWLLAFHFVGDFLLQSHYMSVNKSKSNKVLAEHVFVYSFTVLAGTFLLSAFTSDVPMLIGSTLFAGWLFISHFITDYFTSRWTSRLWKQSMVLTDMIDRELKIVPESSKTIDFMKAKRDNHIHNFFCVIGFDQLLHAAQIILGFYFILKP